MRRPSTARRRAAPAAAAVATLLLAGAGCGDEPSATERRARQVADAATEAGLPGPVADLLADAARGVDGTYRVGYDVADPAGGAVQHVTLTQRPPHRRLDVARDDGSADTTLTEGETSYQCTKPAGGTWSCELLSQGAVPPSGLFDDEAVAGLTDALAAGAADYVFTVEDRDLLGVTARCLVTRRAVDAPDDPALGTEATLCLSPEGARLLTEVPSGTLRATAYTTDLPEDAFELPAPVGPSPP